MSKECMYCGEENEDGAARCVVCGAAFSEETGDSSELVHWYISCPCCGKRYEVKSESDRIAQCETCVDEFDKYEIAHVLPFRVCEKKTGATDACEENTAEIPVLTLFELRKKKRIEITEDVTIDREASDVEPEFFKADCHVSSPHCRISFERGEWRIEDIGSSNCTSVDGVRLIPFFPTVIHDGNYVVIADLVFRASIARKAVKSEQKKEEADPASAPAAKTWAIRCHICGTLYEVDGPEARLSECRGTCRFDEIDRYEIQHDAPQLVERDLIPEKWRM